MCPLYIHLKSAIHPHTPLNLPPEISKNVGIHTTSNLMACGLPLGAFGPFLLGAPPGVDPEARTGVPLIPDSPPRRFSGGVFS
jgi:hypothetical protein